MPHPEWQAMSTEQKMEFLYEWCFQMSEVVQELRATNADAHGQGHPSRGHARGTARPPRSNDLDDLPRGSTSAGALAIHPRTQADTFIRCPACEGWIDCRDLAQVLATL